MIAYSQQRYDRLRFGDRESYSATRTMEKHILQEMCIVHDRDSVNVV